VPADPSSPIPIPAALAHLTHPDPRQLQDADAPQLLAAMEHATRAVLAPRQVGGAPEEVTAFAPLLAPLDLAEVVVTTDALGDPPGGRRVPGGQQARALPVRGQGQPADLLDRCVRLPWQRIPVLDRTHDRGHGRIEIRILKAVPVNHVGFPHAAQILQVTRKTRDLHDHPRRFTTVTVYAVTSLPFEQGSPARLADLLREHWAIEALHYLRDVTFCEDGSQTPHRRRSQRHGLPAQPGHRGAVSGGAGQPRRRVAPPRPRPTPPPRHPRDQPRMNPTSRQNDGALPRPRIPARCRNVWLMAL
jgi:predicted transposase YbfD/YdcC